MEDTEAAYLRGERAAWRSLFNLALHRLGYNDYATQQAAWVAEREAAIAALRTLCRDHGDNKWDEKLHLGDIIEQHLARYLEVRTR